MTNNEIASTFVECLDLERPPIALEFVNEKPASTATTAGPLPSSCSFWIAAEKDMFYASAADHAGCAVGAYVMGFPLASKTEGELMAAVGLMDQVGYLPQAEVANIPRIANQGPGIVYGPLALFQNVPSVVLLWVTPANAMVLEEALKTVAWTSQSADVQQIFGRPGCAAIAQSHNSGRSSFSLGCAGMRTFTEIEPYLGLVVIPGTALEACARDLRAIHQANSKMLDHYRALKAAVA